MRYVLSAFSFFIFAICAMAQTGKSPAAQVPPEFKPKTDVTLTPTAKAAVGVSENWAAELKK